MGLLYLLNLLEHLGPVKACNGIALPFKPSGTLRPVQACNGIALPFKHSGTPRPVQACNGIVLPFKPSGTLRPVQACNGIALPSPMHDEVTLCPVCSCIIGLREFNITAIVVVSVITIMM
jgi:hypothetical protein